MSLLCCRSGGRCCRSGRPVKRFGHTYLLKHINVLKWEYYGVVGLAVVEVLLNWNWKWVKLHNNSLVT